VVCAATRHASSVTRCSEVSLQLVTTIMQLCCCAAFSQCKCLYMVPCSNCSSCFRDCWR
jgi:hypothetical protein